MVNALNALIVEDSEDDCHLLLRELRRGGYLVRFERVDSAAQMTKALAHDKFDIVFADYSLPKFDAPSALELLKRSGIDIPFIIVSGTISEDIAVSAMKAGAHDYLLKNNLKRLLPAVARELREAQQRNERRQADEVLGLQRQKVEEQGVVWDLAHVMVRDLAGRITVWTKGMERLYGWTREQAVGNFSQSLLRTVFPEPLSKIELELRARGFWLGELVHRTKSGEQIVVATQWVLQRDPEGNPLMVIEVNNDITERRRVEEALRVSEAQYRILFDSNPHPIWVYELKTLRFLAVNDAAVRHYGYSREEFMSMTIKGIRAAESNPTLVEQAFREVGGLCKHRKQDGSLIDVEINSHEIVFNGKPAQLVLALDVTEKLKARQALQEKADELAAMTQQLWHASKLATMGELAASIAHDLNNPLATVSLRVETLLNQLTHDEPKQRSLKVIIGEVERMATIVTNLLQFTRRNQRQVSTIHVADELSRSIELISYYLRNRNIQVIEDFDDSLPAILADRQQLRQVFLNLMTNAGDAMPAGGTLTLRVRAETSGSNLLIEFTDTGKGISPDDLNKVWEPFYTSKPEGKGTGLGLSICGRIIEEHGGKIKLKSEVGKGTTARVILPTASRGLWEMSETLSGSSSATSATETNSDAGTHRPHASLTTLMTFHKRHG